jgi:protein-tyrosine-phosphatase/DnaJ-domain-containing protein 1
MARSIADRMARQSGLEDTVFDSAGIAVEKSEPAYVETITFLKREKYNILNHRSKRLSVQVVDNADIVLCMTAELVQQTKELLGDYYAPKVVLLNKAIDLDTKNLDVELPNLHSIMSLRRLYASMLASMGRLVRTLEEAGVSPEYFGARRVAPRLKPGSGGGGGQRKSPSTVDPVKRQYLVNVIFDFVERSFEPPTSQTILHNLKSLGQELSNLELEELLRQDLHGYLRVDRDGVWHVVPGASQKRQEKAKAEARARARANHQQRAEQQKPAPPREEKMTEELAYETLSIAPTTFLPDAQKKFRQLLQRYHPDKFHDDPEFQILADQKIKRINDAWAMVKDKFPNEPIV